MDIAGELSALHAFLMVLSHSRKPAVVWSRRGDELSWLRCHNESFRRLAGVAAVNRIDNVKTAVVQGAGTWGVIHPTYRAYSRAVGFHIDACQAAKRRRMGRSRQGTAVASSVWTVAQSTSGRSAAGTFSTGGYCRCSSCSSLSAVAADQSSPLRSARTTQSTTVVLPIPQQAAIWRWLSSHSHNNRKTSRIFLTLTLRAGISPHRR